MTFDPSASLSEFGQEFLVVCPRCQGRALVRPREAGSAALTCTACGHSDRWVQREPGVLTSGNPSHYRPGQVAMGAPVDWYFHLPLWLQTSCCGETLWACNAAHLAWLEEFVGAKLRTRRPDPESGWSNRSLASRLPRWIQAAGNRDEVLRGVARLKRRLAGAE